MILAGCGGGDSGPTSPTPPDPTPPTPPPAPVATSITVAPSSYTLASIGATVQLTATVRDQNNNTMTGQAVTWTSSDTAVATVSGNGLVTAVSNGTTQITARSGNASGTANITVAEPVPTRIAVTPSSHTLETIGATVQLTATVRDQRNNVMSGQTITWSSGDAAVATVSGTGLVTAVGNGMSEITAQAGDAMGTAAITVTVFEPVATSITIEPDAHTLEAIGATVQLTATVLDQRGNEMMDEAVTWSSGDEAIAMVDEKGLVTAVANGMAEITARSGDVVGTAAITVAAFMPVATSILVEPDAHTLEAIDATVQLTATVLDQRENAMMDATVTWSSGDESVATVDANGLVTAVGNGMAEITAQAGDAMGSAAITVSQVPANISIEVDAEATTLTEIGQTLQLMASVSDSNDVPIAEPDVKWRSSDEAVATVDEDGLVEAVGDGMAEVTATSGEVSDKVSITVMVPVPDIEYVPWEGVTVERGKLILSIGTTSLPLETCITENATIRLFAPLPPEGIKDWYNSFTEDTLTVHYSVWQRSDDMGSTWSDIEATRVMYDACPYDPDVAGEYRLVGDITLNGDKSLRRSENTFTVDP
ncbi:MAG: Ig-like domain-containing protein [Gemmatimonadota bacterium]|nr:Ig-like domain-containing protein [Gemmatimonadota bacterium]